MGRACRWTRRRAPSRIISALLASLALAAPAQAAPSLVEVGRFDRPVRVTSPPGDARLFVVEQHSGRVEIVDPSGTIIPQPFMEVAGLATGNEQGLLSIAFAPDYGASGLVYAFLTPPGKVEIREFRRSATDAGRADPTGRVLFSAAHPRSNHNGGLVTFGPDGQLWFAVGDGGGANDPDAQAQDTATPLGKLHRVDPGSFAPAAGNPFGSVFAYGLRNPWRFSFDRRTGDLIIGDVGQGRREEVDFAPAPERGSGANYGWRCFEGSLRNTDVAPCDPPGHVLPVHELSHDDGACSITGGVVVRDASVPSLDGRYLYGDICKPELRSITLPAGGDDRAEAALKVEQVTDIAEDSCGRVLVSSLAGSVYRLVEGGLGACPSAAPPQAAPVPAGCGLGVRAIAARRATVLRRGLPLRVSVRSACRVSATARIRKVGTLVARSRNLVAGQRVTLRLRAGSRTRAKLRRRTSVTARLTVSAGAERRTARARIRR